MTGLVEIFDTIQGEGTQLGKPSTLIRIGGCNLNCAWCDTANRNKVDPTLVLQDIYNQIRKFPTRDIIITGGEPLLDQPYLKQVFRQIKLAKRFIQRDILVTVETNCTIFPHRYILDGFPNILWSISPKLPSSMESYSIDALVKFAHLPNSQIKFVVADEHDMTAVEESLDYIPYTKEIIFQPVATPFMNNEKYLKSCRLLVASIRDLNLIHPWRILPQWHKLLWD